MQTNKASSKTTMLWNTLPWKKIQRKVFKLQKRIYQASKLGQNAKARKLQKLLVKSYYAKLLAVRKVTQENQGKKTAGVDGKKFLKPQERMKLAKTKECYKSKPLRRVWIPKPGRKEKRPLGIPTMSDRVEQAVVKSVLEPYWEAKFEETSYGFRPGRSAHDAIARIYIAINKGSKYVLDADISKCFDKINHKYLLSKLECPNTIKQKVKQWLKAGVMDNGVFEETKAGTPQGGVISPLLANIALDGMIREIQRKFLKGKKEHRQNYKARIIRYADDFVVISESLEVIQQSKIAIEEWLKPVGLELKPEKTRICHTLKGFDFLGFNIQQYPVGKNHSGKTGGPNSRSLGFKTLIKPSKKAIEAHRDTIKSILKRDKTAPQAAIIKNLNPIIRGWCNYYSTVVSKKTFSKEDEVMWNRLRAITVSRTGKATYKKLKKYFSFGKNGEWTFQTNNGLRLIAHDETPIQRHVLVKPDKSIYDGDWVYWSKRMGDYVDTPKRVSRLIKLQKGKCRRCGQYIMCTDRIEVDHIIPKANGGRDEYKNLQILHKHCHHQKSAKELVSMKKTGVNQEPDEVKISRPVLNGRKDK